MKALQQTWKNVFLHGGFGGCSIEVREDHQQNAMQNMQEEHGFRSFLSLYSRGVLHIVWIETRKVSCL